MYISEEVLKVLFVISVFIVGLVVGMIIQNKINDNSNDDRFKN
jgi:hypothetical protein